MEMLLILTTFDDAGNVTSVEPVVATVVGSAEELAGLLDAAAERGRGALGAN